jgi:hypothetical protein
LQQATYGSAVAAALTCDGERSPAPLRACEPACVPWEPGVYCDAALGQVSGDRLGDGTAVRAAGSADGVRLVIESVFSTLKRQMRMEQHLAKTLAGLAQRIAQRLLALTLAMHINLLTRRPPRALAAYDGR